MIPDIANHLITSGGKRLRPMLTLATAGLCDYTGSGHIKLAATVEFMHTATLLHDDVVDQSNMRRGKLAARMLWGNEATVLVGDFLLGQGLQDDGRGRFASSPRSSLLGCRRDCRRRSHAIGRGEGYADERRRLSSPSSAPKPPRSLGPPPKSGRSSPAARKRRLQPAAAMGSISASPFQLIDDALDYGGKSAKLGKNVGDDFREGKITLPVVLSFRRGTEAERAFLRRTLEAGEIGDGDLETAIAIMRKHRGLEDTVERARHYGAMAHDALDFSRPSPLESRA